MAFLSSENLSLVVLGAQPEGTAIVSGTCLLNYSLQVGLNQLQKVLLREPLPAVLPCPSGGLQREYLDV